MNGSKLALFLSGLFFGGAVDHLILVLLGRGTTPYGVSTGVAGNWAFATLDLTLTVLLYWLHRRLQR